MHPETLLEVESPFLLSMLHMRAESSWDFFTGEKNMVSALNHITYPTPLLKLGQVMLSPSTHPQMWGPDVA